MMLLFWGGLFAVVVVILRHFTSGSLRQRNASPLGSQRGLYRWVTAEVPSIAYRIPEYAELFDESDPRRGPHRPDHHNRPPGRHDHISVRAGPRQQARVRRAPGASGNHINLDQPDAITAVRSEIGSAERRLLLQSAI
jgi:pyruvate,water dikinase